MASLSLDPQGRQPEEGFSSPRELKYRNDVKRAKIEQISKVQDTVDQLRGPLEELKPPGDAVPATLSDQAIQNILDQCQKLHIRAVELETDINLSKRGEARRDTAVSVLRDRAREGLDDFRKKVRDVESAWGSIIRRQEEIRRAELANGVPQFESSKSQNTDQVNIR